MKEVGIRILLEQSAAWDKPPTTMAARPPIVVSVLNSQYLFDNEDGIYALICSGNYWLDRAYSESHNTLILIG